MQPNPNELWRDFHEEIRLGNKQADTTAKGYRLMKNHMYRAARKFIELRNGDLAWLINMVKTAFPNCADPMDRYLDKCFAPLAIFGDDYRELIVAVEKGMTFRDYMTSCPGVFLARSKGSNQKRSADTPLPPEPTEGMSVPKQAEFWRTRALAAEAQIRELRRDRNVDRPRIAKLEKTVEKLHRIINAVEV